MAELIASAIHGVNGESYDVGTAAQLTCKTRPTLHLHCTYTAPINNCTYTVPTLYLLTLYLYCACTVPTLYLHHIYTVPTLHLHCTYFAHTLRTHCTYTALSCSRSGAVTIRIWQRHAASLQHHTSAFGICMKQTL